MKFCLTNQEAKTQSSWLLSAFPQLLPQLMKHDVAAVVLLLPTNLTIKQTHLEINLAVTTRFLSIICLLKLLCLFLKQHIWQITHN